ncbi:hypothetical protein L1049_007309 [Liquidambar formosana]|uniref:Uncharacterized protein n=1 Tax=Liquidambar formosana TaxID=63359 RepID=A0AAP0WSA2_LIQFO
MGRLGCSISGNLDDSKFSKPMPWIGIYVAAASVVCSIAMAADAYKGLRYRKFWFPSKYFSLNATTLTLIAVAVKMSVDLNTAMPSRQDQLAKLSSAVLICTVMGNSMPSIGTMENNDIFMNIMALGILVITLVVNICIQLATGAIYIFWKEHVLVMFLMLVLLVILCFSALTVPTTKHYFERKYSKKHELALRECSAEACKSIVKKLKDDLTKYWMMAHTCCPQFVMGRSVTCTASGAFCLLGAATLAEAMLRSYLTPWSYNFCIGKSDYKWSTNLVLVTQTIAVAVGTIAPASRWFIAINFRCPKRGKKSYKDEFKLESYWIQRLVEMKERPLAVKIHDRRYRKLAHDIKYQALDFCIRMQTGIVLICKLVRLFSILFMGQFMFCIHRCKELTRKIKPDNSILNNDSVSESQPNPKQDLSRFVLHLEGEEELVELMMKNNCDVPARWMRMGKKMEPKYLIQLLEKFAPSQGFKGLGEFDRDDVPSLDTEEPPNCWALPVVTLTSIAIALPGIDHYLKEKLIRSVNQGLMFVRFAENNLYANGDLKNIRRAAEILWLGVDLYHKWLDLDLHKMALQADSSKEILQGLVSVAKGKYMESKNKNMIGCYKVRASKWPNEVLAANSMYRISQTILLDYECKNYQMGERLYEGLARMITDIFGACLTTTLPRVIFNKCIHSTIEKREESVRQAICILGKAENLLKILDQKSLHNLDPDQVVSIDEWRSLIKQKHQLPFISSSSDGDKATLSSPDLCLTIE